MSATCKIAVDAPDMAICFAIRSEVFVKEQKVPIEIEFDDNDSDALHFLLRTDDGQPAGTARLRYADGRAKIERVAIRKSHRGQGLGTLLMEAIIAQIRNDARAARAALGAQVHAIPFYESLGFIVTGDEYLDANIPHKDMELSLIHA